MLYNALLYVIDFVKSVSAIYSYARYLQALPFFCLILASQRVHYQDAAGLATPTCHVGSTEGVRWKGYPSKLLHAAAFRVAKTP